MGYPRPPGGNIPVVLLLLSPYVRTSVGSSYQGTKDAVMIHPMTA